MQRYFILAICILIYIFAGNVQAFDVFMREVQLGPLCSYKMPRLKTDEEMQLPSYQGVIETKGFRHSGGIDYSGVYARYSSSANVSGSVKGIFQSIRSTKANVSGIKCYKSIVPNSIGQRCEANVAMGRKRFGLIVLVVKSKKHPQVLCTLQALYEKPREKYDRSKSLEIINSFKMRE